MKAFLRSFYLLLFAVPAVLLIAGIPRGPKKQGPELSPNAPATLESGVWRVPKYRIELRAPSQWTLQSQKHRELICADTAAPQDACISVISLPNFFHKDLIALEAENQQALIDAKTVTVDSSSRVRLDDKIEALRIDYHGTQMNSEVERRYICLIWLNGAQQMVVTAQGASERWASLGQQIEDALASLKLGAD